MLIASNDTIAHAVFWYVHAVEGLKSDTPESSIHHWTHPNYSSHTGWDESISSVYFNPVTMEERLLQGLVHRFLLAALEIMLEKAERDTPHAPWTAWSGMDVAESYRIARMIDDVDPLAAYDAQLRICKLCERMSITLFELIEMDFKAFTRPAS